MRICMQQSVYRGGRIKRNNFCLIKYYLDQLRNLIEQGTIRKPIEFTILQKVSKFILCTYIQITYGPVRESLRARYWYFTKQRQNVLVSMEMNSTTGCTACKYVEKPVLNRFFIEKIDFYGQNTDFLDFVVDKIQNTCLSGEKTKNSYFGHKNRFFQ